MEFIPVKSKKVIWTDDDLVDVFLESGHALQERDIFVITSKVVSLEEKRIVPAEQCKNKQDLIRDEVDYYVGRGGHNCHLTIKSNALLPTAGIDESNAQGHYILWPKDPFSSAEKLHSRMKKKLRLKDLGVLITDSHTTPFRSGVSGFAVSYWGFKGARCDIGKRDLFGRELKSTFVNVADNIAGPAVLLMGESGERIPFVIIRGAPVEFTEKTNRDELMIPYDEDIYYPIFKKYMK